MIQPMIYLGVIKLSLRTITTPKKRKRFKKGQCVKLIQTFTEILSIKLHTNSVKFLQSTIPEFFPSSKESTK